MGLSKNALRQKK